MLWNLQLLPVAELAKQDFRLTIHLGTFLAYYRSARDALSEVMKTGSVESNAQDIAIREQVDLLGVGEMDALGRKHTGRAESPAPCRHSMPSSRGLSIWE
jgi:hypothetical protein